MEFLNSSTASLFGYGARGGMVVVPDGMRGDEPFRESDHACAIGGGFCDQAAGFGH